MTKPKTSDAGRIGRREALTMGLAGAGVGVASVLGWSAAHAQRPAAFPPPRDPDFGGSPSWTTELREIGPDCFTYVQGNGPPHNGGGISNAGFVVGAHGIMVFDALAGPLMAQGFIARIRAISDKPFERLVYTHHHGDHTNGGQYFLAPGLEVVGTPYCRERLLQMAASAAGGPDDPAYGNIPSTFQAQEGRALGGEPRNLLPPNTTISATTSYYYGDTVVELIPPGIAHTWGDILVYLPEYRTLWMGDNGFFHMAPFAHNGHPTRWMELLQRILDMDVEHIVPGHGPVSGKAAVQEMLDYFTLLKSQARQRYDAGMSPGRAAAEIRMGRFDNWMGAERIILNLYRFYKEFEGTLDHNLDLPGFRVATAEYNTLVGGTPEAARRIYHFDSLHT